MKIITKDLFEASYFLAKGLHLQDIISSKRTILFQFDHQKQIDDLRAGYIKGEAEVNVLHLKNSMNHLRDIMFSKLKQIQPVSKY